ncbi:uncharacterized protein BDW70DRAFT_125408 [Aspergillus foveolatus]|uniref:uncharacterized protein n=1 Tax=Aspergillus foveolatus TaxID=210207 RepID=UPI003CCE49DF
MSSGLLILKRQMALRHILTSSGTAATWSSNPPRPWGEGNGCGVASLTRHMEWKRSSKRCDGTALPLRLSCCSVTLRRGTSQV